MINGEQAPDSFIKAMTEGLFGAEPAPVRENKETSVMQPTAEPISDKRAINVNVNAKALADVFARSGVQMQPVTEQAPEEVKSTVFEQFKEEAEAESLGVLSKMLKGLK